MSSNITALGVHSETGRLRTVLICPPGLAHRRLTPANCDELLFDDVYWVDVARRDHDEFRAVLAGHDVEVLDLQAMLAEARSRTIDSASRRTLFVIQPGTSKRMSAVTRAQPERTDVLGRSVGGAGAVGCGRPRPA
jgi:arginine deiminase